MCLRGKHEVVCPGVIYCHDDKTLKIWMSKLRAALGIRYADMADSALLHPVCCAAIDAYGVDGITKVDVYTGGKHFSFAIQEGRAL